MSIMINPIQKRIDKRYIDDDIRILDGVEVKTVECRHYRENNKTV